MYLECKALLSTSFVNVLTKYCEPRQTDTNYKHTFDVIWTVHRDIFANKNQPDALYFLICWNKLRKKVNLVSSYYANRNIPYTDTKTACWSKKPTAQ